MFKSDEIKQLADALCKFQAEQSPIAPNATNPFLKNKYADLPALISGTKANLKKHGLSVTQLLSNGGVSTLLLHISGEYIGDWTLIEAVEGKGTTHAQQMGIAITYTRRYGYASILGLVTDEDTDGGDPSGKAPKKTPQKQKEDIPDPSEIDPKSPYFQYLEWMGKKKSVIVDLTQSDKDYYEVLKSFKLKKSSDVDAGNKDLMHNVMEMMKLKIAELSVKETFELTKPE